MESTATIMIANTGKRHGRLNAERTKGAKLTDMMMMNV
jgi:hypothetical protein